jgi:hypothetical protein
MLRENRVKRIYVGLARNINTWCTHGHFSREMTKHTAIYRVGQNHTYTVCIRYFWQGNHQTYGHIRCIYTDLANPSHIRCNYTDLASPTGDTND